MKVDLEVTFSPEELKKMCLERVKALNLTNLVDLNGHFETHTNYGGILVKVTFTENDEPEV